MQNRPLPKIDHELPMIETGLQRGVRVKTVSFGPNEVETDVEIIITQATRTTTRLHVWELRNDQQDKR